jgi:acyl-CoA reductase-like NAD-dependent aldehyde dehydrogenase
MNFDGRAFINGQRVPSINGTEFDCISPVDGRVLVGVAQCGAEDIDLAVQVARRAFEDGRWRFKSPLQRKRILMRWADLMLQHSETLAMTETLDMGKPIQYARTVDVKGAANCIRWYGEAIDKVYGEIAPTPVEALALITQEPVGVVGLIVPWNYPMLMAAWKIAPALATGNSVILKPSEKSPLSALILADLALQAGIPAGVFNVVPGTGQQAGAPLALHNDVDCIAFTGSTHVGKQIHAMAAQSNLKRAWTELGGKSPNIVFADCPDLDKAVETAVTSIFFNQGQSCNAPSRLLIEASISEAFLEKALALVPRFAPSNPLLPDTVMGAMVDALQTRNVLRYIETGKCEGAKLLVGGEQVMQETGGYYVEPTIFTGVTENMTIAREEIFGPVLAVQCFDDATQAVRLANNSIYGLHAGVWTRDIHKAHSVARALRVGTVHVNQYDEDDMTVPFGGFKQSGIGRDKSLHALHKYTETKTTWIRIDNPLMKEEL